MIELWYEEVKLNGIVSIYNLSQIYFHNEITDVKYDSIYNIANKKHSDAQFYLKTINYEVF